MKVCGQKLVKFCAHTHTRGSISSKDNDKLIIIFYYDVTSLCQSLFVNNEVISVLYCDNTFV